MVKRARLRPGGAVLDPAGAAAFIAASLGAVEERKGQVGNDETSQWKVTQEIMSPLEIMIRVGCASVPGLSRV